MLQLVIHMLKKKIIAEDMPAGAPVKRPGIIIQKLNILLQPLRERNERHYRDSQFHLWADIILAAILIGSAILLIWLLVWQPKPAFSLETRLETSKILSGQSEDFIIEYRNQEDADIQAATLTAELPEHFVFESATPTDSYDESSHTFLLGDLKRGQQGQLRLKGIIQGGINDTQSLNLNLLYHHKGVRKQALSLFSYRIDGSVLELNLDMPEKAFAGIPVAGAIELKNSGRSTVNNADIVFLSQGWEIHIESTEPGSGRLSVKDLKAGETRRIGFNAVTKQTSGQLPLEVQGELLENQTVLTQFKVAKIITLSEPALGVSASYIDKALVGTGASLIVNFQNNHETDISDISFTLKSNRDSFVVTGVTTSSENMQISNASVMYQKNLKPGERASATIAVALDRKNIALNDFVPLVVGVRYIANNQPYEFEVALPELKVASNISVTSGGYYYSEQGDQLGIGPLPPKAGVPTTYWIIWEANNVGNDISGFEVSGELPGNVAWLDQQSLVAGSITYSPITRRVLWQVDNLSKSGGQYRASFAVSLVPNDSDIGKIPALLSNIAFKGVDQYTGNTLSRKLANITSNIENDRRAAGKGKVEPLE